MTQPLLLDTEKVACRYDTVIFPPKSTFLVGLETGADVYISSLILDGKVLFYHYALKLILLFWDRGVTRKWNQSTY